MALGQRIIVCGRDFDTNEKDRDKRCKDSYPVLKLFNLDDGRSDTFMPSATLKCGTFSTRSVWVFLCKNCAVENGLEW